MRLIDADALKMKLQARHDNGDEDFDKGYNIGIGTAIDLIDNAPTVNPVCWNCVHFGEKAVTGHCIKCRDKDMWEAKKNDNRL